MIVTGARRPAPFPDAPGAMAVPLPLGSTIERDSATRVLEDGRVLIGGKPLRVLRLTSPGAAAVARWDAGYPLAGRGGEQLLARRLVATGLFHARPEGRQFVETDVTVVVPVRDRTDQLRRLLATLGDLHVVVVDDGSVDPASVAAVARDSGADLVALPRNVGPGAARNAGLSGVTTPLVAFVDSDCVPSPGWLRPLLDHFDDPTIAAVAPRVLAAGNARHWFGRYERARPPLDRGPRAGLVRCRGQIPFVPAATLVLRTELAAGSGFDETMRGGEDVDLVWRLVDAGWSVRYDPTSTVAHDVRSGWRPWLVQRFGYGATAGALWLGHPADVRPMRIPVSNVLTWALVLTDHPLLATTCAAGTAGVLARRISGTVDRPLRASIGLVARGTAETPLAVATGLTRLWGPAMVALLGFRRTRRLAAAILVAPAVSDWTSAVGAPNPLSYIAAHLLDDLTYSAGVWVGCLQAATVGPLVPDLVWPTGDSGRALFGKISGRLRSLRRAEPGRRQAKRTTPRTLRPASMSS